MSNQTTTPVEVRETEVTRYSVVCPECDEWHEHDESWARKPAFECICGTWIKVVR
jgi:hypothetical protein